MKNLFIISVFFSIVAKSNSQIHWLINQDKVTNCKVIESGKFINKITDCESTPGYYLEFKDGYCYEYIESGKYYLKSKIDFENPCKYVSTILETTIPNYKIEVGSKIYTEILETASVDKLVKIRSRGDGEWQTFVLEKIE